MIEFLENSLLYLTGLWALPWILIGFLSTSLFSKIFGYHRIDRLLKKIGLIILYFFIPLLLFRIFLNIDFGETELIFSATSFLILSFMYLLAFFLANRKGSSLNLPSYSKKKFVATIIANQGRSSAFIGGAMLAVAFWQVPAAIFMNISAIFLFAIIPFFLSRKTKVDNLEKRRVLPWYLRFFPWYLLFFAFLAISLHATTGLVTSDFGEMGIVFKFFTALTIPSALFYVGAGLRLQEISLLFKKVNRMGVDKLDEITWAKYIVVISIIITPLLFLPFLGIAYIMNIIPKEWFIVFTINILLPITSTNMFLVPYGINKKVTALSVAWTTIICVPIVVFLITLFKTLTF